MPDANICIFLIQKTERVLQRLKERDPEDICISAVTYAELIHGAEKSSAAEKNRALLMQLLSCIEVLDFDSRAADAYGNIRSDPENKGYPIEPLDTMIAGHAGSPDHVLAANNTREIKRVENLAAEDRAAE